MIKISKAVPKAVSAAVPKSGELRHFLQHRPAVLVAAGLVLAVALWMATGMVGSGGGNGAATVAPDGADVSAANGDGAPLFPVSVVVSEAQKRTARLVINGRTEPYRTVDMRAEIEGRLEELELPANCATSNIRGCRVQRGDVIAKIALYDREAKLAEARALLRQREVEFAASQSLVEQEYRSETQHAAARAQLDAARAVVEQRQTDVERTNIRAPFDGVIHDGHAELGDYLRAGDDVLTILDLDPILVVGHATEMQVAALELGNPAAAELVDGTVIEGTISYVAARAEETTRTYRYEIEVPNPDFRIRAGLTARTLVEAGETTAHLIPSSAMTLSGDGAIGVKIVDDDDVVQFVAIRVIEDAADGLWVDGLPATVRVIAVGHEFVVEGQKVRPVESAARGAVNDAARPPDTIAEQPASARQPTPRGETAQ